MQVVIFETLSVECGQGNMRTKFNVARMIITHTNVQMVANLRVVSFSEDPLHALTVLAV